MCISAAKEGGAGKLAKQKAVGEGRGAELERHEVELGGKHGRWV